MKYEIKIVVEIEDDTIDNLDYMFRCYIEDEIVTKRCDKLISLEVKAVE